MAWALYGVVLLILLPPLLMVAAHMFALGTQDRSEWVVVVLDPRVRSVETLVQTHARRYHLTIGETWTHSFKGYTAFAPHRYLDALEADRWVQRVELQESDEFR